MKRTPVPSTSIAAIGYDVKRKKLEVEFVNGRVYSYSKVPPGIVARLRGARSIGNYFSAHIRSAYESADITPPVPSAGTDAENKRRKSDA